MLGIREQGLEISLKALRNCGDQFLHQLRQLRSPSHPALARAHMATQTLHHLGQVPVGVHAAVERGPRRGDGIGEMRNDVAAGYLPILVISANLLFRFVKGPHDLRKAVRLLVLENRGRRIEDDVLPTGVPQYKYLRPMQKRAQGGFQSAAAGSWSVGSRSQ
jgi:hypothetical protein